MKEKVIDCTGLACPKPVLEAKDALETVVEEGIDTLVVIVDNEAARSNVERFLKSQGCKVEIEPLGGKGFRLTATIGSHYQKRPVEISCTPSTALTTDHHPSDALSIVFRSDTLGDGDKELGTTLMDAFCHTLLEIRPLPQLMVFYNRGVLLTLKGSVVVDALKEFEQRGVKLLVCGTCLRFYEVEELREVGQVSNMFEILEALSKAPRIMTP